MQTHYKVSSGPLTMMLTMMEGGIQRMSDHVQGSGLGPDYSTTWGRCGIRPVSHSSEKINRLFEVSELLYKY